METYSKRFFGQKTNKNNKENDQWRSRSPESTDEEDCVPNFSYKRTSTPLMKRRGISNANLETADAKYTRWCKRLQHPPSKLRVKGVVVPPQGIVSGHLVDDTSDKKDLGTNIYQQHKEEIYNGSPSGNYSSEKKSTISQKLKESITDRMTWLKKTLHLSKRDKEGKIYSYGSTCLPNSLVLENPKSYSDL